VTVTASVSAKSVAKFFQLINRAASRTNWPKNTAIRQASLESELVIVTMKGNGVSPRILIVEDHGDTRRVLSTLLDRWGFDVSTAESLKSGLAFVDAKEFDVIVSDIALPDGTGYALVSEAKRKQGGLKAIAISGYNSSADVEIGKIAGFDYHLTKPFDCHALRTILSGVQPKSA
jgi:CheY-like chemotaxis protein